MSWECHYCSKVFVREATFMKHKCPQMARAEDIKKPEGLGAYELYSEWMRCHGRKVPQIETFSTSRYFNSFVNFFKKAKQLNLPNVKTFIELMVSKDISPMLWTRDECYSLYLERIDRASDPIDLANASIKTLFDISEAAGVDVKDVFTVLHYREVMQLIRQRQLTPWLLLCSKAFKQFLTNLQPMERDELTNLIGFAYWSEKFEANPKIVKHMKDFNEAIGI